MNCLSCCDGHPAGFGGPSLPDFPGSPAAGITLQPRSSSQLLPLPPALIVHVHPLTAETLWLPELTGENCISTFGPALGCRVVACPFSSLVAHPILFVTYAIFFYPIFFLFCPFFYVACPIFMSLIPFNCCFPSHLCCSSRSLFFLFPIMIFLFSSPSFLPFALPLVVSPFSTCPFSYL